MSETNPNGDPPEVTQAIKALAPIVTRMTSQGVRPVEILRAISDTDVGRALQHRRILGLIVLMRLFNLDLTGAKTVGGWHRYGYGKLTDDAINDVLLQARA